MMDAYSYEVLGSVCFLFIVIAFIFPFTEILTHGAKNFMELYRCIYAAMGISLWIGVVLMKNELVSFGTLLLFPLCGAVLILGIQYFLPKILGNKK